MEPERRIRVVVVDDHPIFRVGLTRALESTPLEVIGEAGSAAEALALVAQTRPDVLLLDIVLPDGDGMSVCRALRSRSPTTIVIMLSSFDDVATMRASRQAGARGHLAKDTPARIIVQEVERLVMEPTATAFARLGPQGMTERELDVLERLALGMTYVAIADQLAIAPETVKSYLREVYGKLGVHDRASAIEEGRRRGYLAAPPRLGVPDRPDEP